MKIQIFTERPAINWYLLYHIKTISGFFAYCNIKFFPCGINRVFLNWIKLKLETPALDDCNATWWKKTQV